MAMRNWKRILAGVGTAALLASNLGSVTQAVFADDDYREQIPAAQQNIDEVDESDESGEDADIDAQDLGSEGTPAVEQGQNGSNPNGSENGDQNRHEGQSGQNGQDDDTPGAGVENEQDGNTPSGENDDRNSDNQNTNNDSNGDQDQHTGDNQGAGNQGDDQNNNENGDEPGTDDTNPQNLADDQTDPDANPDAPNPNPADENPDLDGGIEGSESSTPALEDSLRITLETHESSKRDVTRSEDGTYLYDLGETASTTVTLSNPEDYRLEESDNAVVRVYMQFTDNAPEDPATDDEAETDDAGKDADDADLTEDEATDPDEDADSDTDEADETDTSAASTQGSTRQPGTYTIPAEDDAPAYSYTVYGLDDGITCYEIDRPIGGDTFSLEMTSVYGKDTDGGENQIWVVALTADEAKTLDAEAAEQNEDADEQSEAANLKSEDTDEAENAETASEDERETDDTDEIVVGVAAVPGDEELVDHLQWSKIEEVTEEDSDIQVQTATTENYVVSVAYGPEANIPEDAELRVTEFGEDTEEYREASAQIGDDMEWLLDIAFYVGGTEIEPDESIGLSVMPIGDHSEDDMTSAETSAKAAKEENNTSSDADDEDAAGIDNDFQLPNKNTTDDNYVELIHFSSSGIELIPADKKDTEAVGFSLDSLSLVARPVNEGSGNGVEPQANDAATKPQYPESVEPSVKKTGTTTMDGIDDVTVIYKSDEATSDIEDQFTGDYSQDGKVLTDKSVVYGDDDYDAFSYENGEFGITLSALGQEYETETEDSYKPPIDVVFVLDVSGSMSNYANGRDGDSRREAMVSAVNNAMSQVLQDSNSRVGVAIFSSQSWALLPVDHYTANRNGAYLTAGSGANGLVGTASGIRDGNGNTVAQTYGNTHQNWGTYTQHGIARGAQLFDNVDSTTCWVTTESGKRKLVKRQPVFILVTDGEPTHCTDSYDNVLGSSTVAYGNGQSNSANNKGIMGYNTILSANYYKGLVSNKYNKTALFYTVGEGIAATGGTNLTNADTCASAYYKRAVLDPDTTNVNAIGNDQTQGRELSISTTSTQLYQLLNGSYNDTSVSVGNPNDADPNNYSPDVKWSTSAVPVVKPNPYSNGYDYADGSKFGDLDANAMQDFFKEAIATAQHATEYKFSLKTGEPVTVTDQIGTGMEIKSDLVLRFGSQNYTLTLDKTEDLAGGGTKQTYKCDHTVTYATAYPLNTGANSIDTSEQLDLSKIVVTVTTDANGDQTVRMDVPQDLMPTYFPEAGGTFYYQEDPVRLIYKVGLTQKAINDANELEEGKSLDYYTNKWRDGAGATGTFEPADTNKYGFDKDGTVAKTENTTETSENSFASNKSNDKVTQTLGNNGKLTIKKGGTTNVKVRKVWADDQTSHNNITVNLIQIATDKDGKVTESTIQSPQTLNASNGWTYEWKDLPLRNKASELTYTYRVQETVPSGYVARYENTTDAEGNAVWTITNTPESRFGVGVVKKWFNNDGSPMETAPDKTVTGTLHRNKAKTNTGVTVELVYNYRSGSYNNYTWNPVTLQTIQVATGSSFSYYYANSYDRRQSIPNWTPEISDSSVATVTLSGNDNDSRQVNVRITGNDGDYVKITVGTDTVFNYSTPNMHIEFAQNYTAPSGSGVSGPDTDWSRSFTLTKDNNWSQYWTPEELGEESGYKYSYWAEENKIDGYTTVVDYGTKDTALSPTESGKTITISNTKDAAYELPETGGMGALPIELGGSAAMLGAMFVGYSRRRRDRKEGEM